MSKFGWSYPAGAANDPFAPYNQTEQPCAVCGQWPDNCICPECSVCGVQGDPICYDSGIDCSWCGRREPNHGEGFAASWCGAAHNGIAHTRVAIASHGLERSPEQLASRAAAEAQWRAEAQAWGEGEL